MPDNIPVEVVEHRLSEEERVCPQCGETMREIGTEVQETLKLSRQTMSDWCCGQRRNICCPVYEELRRQLVKCEALHADETTLQVLHEPGKKAQAKNYMWLYRTGREDGPPIVLYKYQPGRKAEHAEKFLEGFSGYLHADGYQGYLCTPYLYYNTTR